MENFYENIIVDYPENPLWDWKSIAQENVMSNEMKRKLALKLKRYITSKWAMKALTELPENFFTGKSRITYLSIWKKLSQHKNLNKDFVMKNSDKPWDWNKLSKNPKLSIKVTHATNVPTKKSK